MKPILAMSVVWLLVAAMDDNNAAEPSRAPNVQLYDLSADIAESHNVQAEHPKVVATLTKLLAHYVEEGRSTPGAKQNNDVAVSLVKSNKKHVRK